MNQLPKESKIIEISIDGLDHVFTNTVDSQFKAIPGCILDDSPGLSPKESPNNTPSIPAAEAAELLGISYKATLKRLQKGTLKGYKTPIKGGEKWMVFNHEIPSFDQDQEETIIEVKSQLLPEQAKVVPIEIFQDLAKQVTELVYHKGFLEGQLLEKDREITRLLSNQQEYQNQIKLLTDSHRKTKWQKFIDWFFQGKK